MSTRGLWDLRESGQGLKETRRWVRPGLYPLLAVPVPEVSALSASFSYLKNLVCSSSISA